MVGTFAQQQIGWIAVMRFVFASAFCLHVCHRPSDRLPDSTEVGCCAVVIGFLDGWGDLRKKYLYK